MFYLVDFLGLQAQEAASQVTLRKLLRGGHGGSRNIQESCNKKTKRLLLIKEN